MRRRLLIGLAVIGVACVAFFAGVLIDRRFPSLFGSEPSPPQLVAPLDGAILPNAHGTPPGDYRWDFRCSEIPGAELYEFAIYDPAGRLREHPEVSGPEFHIGSSGRSWPAESLQGWMWRVRVRVDGRWSKWSETRRFSVEPARP